MTKYISLRYYFFVQRLETRAIRLPRLHHKDDAGRGSRHSHIVLPSGNVFVPPVAGTTPGGRMLRDSLAGLVNPAAAARATTAAEAASKAAPAKAKPEPKLSGVDASGSIAPRPPHRGSH